jgi:hypothetical protein
MLTLVVCAWTVPVQRERASLFGNGYAVRDRELNVAQPRYVNLQ